MRKDIKRIFIKEKEISFKNASLYVGRNNGITYILSIQSPKGISHDLIQNEEIMIVTSDGEEKVIEGTLGEFNTERAIFYINGEPFPVTQGEINRFY